MHLEQKLQKQIDAAAQKFTEQQNRLNGFRQLAGIREQKFQQAQGEIGAALGKLIAVSENYPELKANENFKELQAQLEGTENRIQKSRKEYNDAVQDYNVGVRRFPGNLVANIFGFETKINFKVEEGTEKVPNVQF